MLVDSLIKRERDMSTATEVRAPKSCWEMSQ